MSLKYATCQPPISQKMPVSLHLSQMWAHLGLQLQKPLFLSYSFFLFEAVATTFLQGASSPCGFGSPAPHPQAPEAASPSAVT